MAPDDILEQPDLAVPTLNLACDPIGRLVVAVRIVSPADENGSRVSSPTQSTIAAIARSASSPSWGTKRSGSPRKSIF